MLFEGILLKPSMVTPGADSPKREKPEVVADYTLKLLKRRVPPAVPGVHWGDLSLLPASVFGWHLAPCSVSFGNQAASLLTKAVCMSRTVAPLCSFWLSAAAQHV